MIRIKRLMVKYTFESQIVGVKYGEIKTLPLGVFIGIILFRSAWKKNIFYTD
jgi:hypothetical protein